MRAYPSSYWLEQVYVQAFQILESRNRTRVERHQLHLILSTKKHAWTESEPCEEESQSNFVCARSQGVAKEKGQSLRTGTLDIPFIQHRVFSTGVHPCLIITLLHLQSQSGLLNPSLCCPAQSSAEPTNQGEAT